MELGWIAGVVGVGTLMGQWLLQVQRPKLLAMRAALEAKIQADTLVLAGQVQSATTHAKSLEAARKLMATSMVKTIYDTALKRTERDCWILTLLALLASLGAAIVTNPIISISLLTLTGLFILVALAHAFEVSAHLDKLEKYQNGEPPENLFNLQFAMS